ncbi:hypothetical protein BK816_07700 [Boudabousia tangfeifanii]|uniref:SLH domain-containing protein n=1 Tax=Boudabousia tangfeifanii TaxID=1912795 RepID=A0A1D9MM01_9ACTO|nr:S-layer homology domain-containing protein [Boudabousia tangfeifanii]AOZ73193.1 hypothetical protein BK816_07700 [Boudabousia tangfeifanii]
MRKTAAVAALATLTLGASVFTPLSAPVEASAAGGGIEIARAPLTGGKFVDVSRETLFSGEMAWLANAKVSTGWPARGGRAYRPLANIERQAMAAFLYRLAGIDKSGYRPPSRATFKDVPVGSQFFKEVEWMAATGITKGWPDKSFRPLGPVNRDAMAAFLARFVKKYPSKVSRAIVELGAPGSAVGNVFVDVPVGTQFAAEMEWLKKTEISTGWVRAGKRFYQPVTPIHRDAMAAFLYRLKNNKAATPTKPKPTPAKPKPAPAKPAPVKPVPAKPAPAKPAPVKPVPAKPAPAKPAPVKPAPQPAKPSPVTPVPSPEKPAAPENKAPKWLPLVKPNVSDQELNAARKTVREKCEFEVKYGILYCDLKTINKALSFAISERFNEINAKGAPTKEYRDNTGLDRYASIYLFVDKLSPNAEDYVLPNVAEFRTIIDYEDPIRVFPDLNLPNLRKLELVSRNKHAVKIPDFSHLPILSRLDLDAFSDEVVPNFSHLNNLEALFFMNCKNPNTKKFTHLSNLKDLSFSLCDFDGKMDFSNFSNLESLRFYGAEFKKGLKFVALPNLKELIFTATGLKQVPDFTEFPNLESLYIEDGAIADDAINPIPDFKHMPNLKVLGLWTSGIKEVPDFSHLPKLELINLEGNSFKTCPKFTHLPKDVKIYKDC